MRAVDASVLVRLLARDDPLQLEAAQNFIAGGAWASTLVLAEAIWVMATGYVTPPDRIATGIENLLDHRDLVLQDADADAAALADFRRRPTRGFSDCLILALARKAGHLPLGTFDRSLAKLDGAQAP